MITPDGEISYSTQGLKLRAILIFFLSVFLFLAAGTELMDIATAYLNTSISPRMALLILTLLQMFIWLIVGFMGTFKLNPLQTIFLMLISASVLLSYLFAETDLGIIFGSYSEEMRSFNTIVIGINIFLAALHTAYTDFKRQVSQQKRKT